jgi:hypothetical protein
MHQSCAIRGVRRGSWESPFSQILPRHLKEMLNAIFVRAFQRVD